MRVLAAVDGSDVSAEVLRGAVVLADLLGAEADALYVGAQPSVRLQQMAAGTGVRLAHRQGSVVEVLQKSLSEPDVVLGVLGMGPDGPTRTPAERTSTAAAVMSGVQRPLLVIPEGSFPEHRRHVRRAMVPLDGRQESVDAVEPLLHRLASADVELVVVHVFDPATVPSFWDQPQHAGQAWEREFLHRNLPLQRTRLRLCRGRTAEAVVQTAVDERSDLIVVGWSRDLSSGHALALKSLLGASTLPVLMVPVGAPPLVDLTEVDQPVIVTS